MAFQRLWLVNFIYFLGVISLTSGFLSKKSVKRDSEPNPTFHIKEIRYDMSANSLGGTVVAEVVVSDHNAFDVGWNLRMKSAEKPDEPVVDYTVPIADAIGHKVYCQRFWQLGDKIISCVVSFEPVPRVPHITLVLEIRTRHYGPWLWYVVQIPVSAGSYPHTQTLHPEHPSVISYPQPPVHHQPGEEVDLVFEFKSKLGMEYAQFGVSLMSVASSPYKIMNPSEVDEDAWTIKHKPQTFTHEQYVLTDITVHLNAAQVQDPKVVMVTVYQDAFHYMITIPVVPLGVQSVFQNEGPHMDLEPCAYGAKVYEDKETGLAKFHFDSKPNCVVCLVSHVGHLDMMIYRDGIPVGGGSSHAVYWNRAYPDIAIAKFITYGQNSHQYTYAGNYTCSAYSGWDLLIERQFEITID